MTEMFQLHVVLDQPRNWLDYTPFVSADASVLADPSKFIPVGDEHRKFRQTMQNAEMLFNNDVFKYLQEVDQTTIAIGTSYRKMETHPGDISAIDENSNQFQHLSDLWQARPNVFRRDLSLG